MPVTGGAAEQRGAPCAAIQAWIDLTGHQLESWEVSLLRQLSGAYLDEFHLAGDEKRAPPTGKPKLNSDEVEAKLEALFQGFEAAGFAAPGN